MSNEPTRILYVCLDPGVPIGSAKGASVHVWELIRALGKEGHAVGLVARDVVAAPADVAHLTVLGKPPRGRRLPGIGPVIVTGDRYHVRRGLAAAIKRFEPDVIYERYTLDHSPVAAIASRYGITHVLEVNAPLARERGMATGRTVTPQAIEAEHAEWRRADLVVVPSHPLADMLRAAGQHSVLVVPNAVDPELFTPRDESELSDSLGLANRLVIGFAGTARPWHDLSTVVEAVAALPQQLRPLLFVIGESPPPEITSAAARQDVDLVVTGPLPHAVVPRYLALVDVAVVSLRPEPEFSYFSPLKALEYLATGCPTVVANVGDLRMLSEHEIVVSYAAGDPGSLAAALYRVGTDLTLRAQLRASGRAFASTRTWRGVARTLMTELGSTTTPAPQPAPLAVH
jgi:glycosyltransferase involved in cell wall biosynthesis